MQMNRTRAHRMSRTVGRTFLRGALVGAVAILAIDSSALAGQSADETAVSDVLDALHQAASDADFERYFGLYADEFIFLGTDATERWDRDQFMEYARGPFSQGRGWTYTKLERHVYIAPDGQAAWFDERLDNANLGETRGSGALIKQDGEWKISQYNLTIPIPNEMAREVAAKIREISGR